MTDYLQTVFGGSYLYVGTGLHSVEEPVVDHPLCYRCERLDEEGTETGATKNNKHFTLFKTKV